MSPPPFFSLLDWWLESNGSRNREVIGGGIGQRAWPGACSERAVRQLPGEKKKERKNSRSKKKEEKPMQILRASNGRPRV